MDSTPPPPAPQPAFPPPPPAPAPAPAPNRTDGFFDATRRIGIVRTPNRWIGGVAGGIAQRFGIDPLLVRALFGVTLLFGGAGLIVYGLGWALLPEQADGRIHLQETLRGRFDAALLGAIAMFIIGLNQGSGWFGLNNGGLGWLNGLLWFAATVTVIALVIAAVNQRGTRRPAAGPQGPMAQGPGAPTPGTPSTYTYPYPAAAYPTAAYPTAPYPTAPYPTATPPAWSASHGPTGSAPVPPPPSRPVKPPVYGPGAGAIGAVVGLSLLALAALLVADRQGVLSWSVGLTAAGIAIVLAGLGIVVAGLRGRSSGTLGFLGIVGIVLAVPAAIVAPLAWNVSTDNVRAISDSQWAPTTAAAAQDGLTVGVGDVAVDLTQFPIGDSPVRVPISLGVGDLRVTVPQGTAVSANIRVGVGDITWEVDRTEQISGVSGSRSYGFVSDEVTSGASPELVLQIDSGAASIRVVEENSVMEENA